MLEKTQKFNFREERDFGQKLNVTFYFIKSHFRPLCRLVLLYGTPLALVSGLLSGVYQARLMQRVSGASSYDSYADLNFFSQLNSLNYFAMLFFTVVSVLVLSLAVYSYMVLYQDHDQEAEPAEVWPLVKEHLVKVIYSGIAIGVLIVLTVALLGIGVYLSVVMSIFVIVMVREETGFVETTERCFALVKRNWWATFGFILTAGFIQAVFGWLASIPVGMVAFLRGLQVPGMESELLLVVASVISSVLTIYVYVISIVAVGFQYYNLVEKKDGIGYLEQAELIGRHHQTTSANEGHY
ncbi:hypothetical protein ACMA1I_08310 [Pontibacter sp. 13R65]|uniref:hypothetical protein n=1 Tax=Pontibacter sp. 13R65 TaxID=3127458 RepID=UPI00301C01E8